MNRWFYPRGLRYVLRKLHLYIGLVTGIIVLIVSLTGCCWVFQAEIKAWLQDDPQIEVREQSMISPTKAKSLAHQVFPQRRVHSVIYGAKDEPLEVVLYEASTAFYRSIFLHPFSGEVIRVENHHTGFFNVVLDGHLHLWLPHKIGKQVVSWSIVLFLISLGTGLYLWWPRNKYNRKQRFGFYWRAKTSWKRKNFDIHAITGFYVFIFALLFGITGLTMSFNWMKTGVYQALGGDKKATFQTPNNIHTSPAPHASSIDQLPAKLRQEHPQALSYEIHYPDTATTALYVEISYYKNLYYNNDYRYYDRYTLNSIPPPTIYGAYENADWPAKLIRMNYDLHVGTLLGLPGKILAFIASLTIASLPITGVLLWWGRRRKTPLRRRRKSTRKQYKEKKRSTSVKKREPVTQ